MTADAAMPSPPEVTRQLAAFAANLRFGDLPQAVVAHIKQAALDGLGCCLIGATLPWTRMLADEVAADGGAAHATVIGTRLKAPLAGAALVNATAGHAFELDDIHRDSIAHPNSLTVPIALNAAEYLGNRTGQEVLTAIVAGYEVGNRAGAAAGTPLLLRGFHPQGTVGAFCAAATAGHMLKLDETQMLHALGIAGSLGAGLMAAQEGAMVKRMHSGRAAEAGVRAAGLAKRGFTGIEDVVEAGYGGFISAFGGHSDWSRALAGLGSEWETLKTGYKPHATVTSIHAALDSLAAIMRDNGLTAGDIAKITADVSHPTFVHCAWAYQAKGITSAQMNIYYGLTMIALYGQAFVQQFTDDMIGAAEVMDYMKRIAVRVDPEIEQKGPTFRHMARIHVETVDGRKFSHTETHRRGSPDNPISAADLKAKFMALAEPVLGADGAAELEHEVSRLDRLDDTGRIMELLGNPL